ncbi:DnaA/Hda family protein [Shimia sp. CNT1-13L.2]|uniref:DnaA ATPase domain-containing protein n=1 Tax=Shimia sp. CNT1-13L.2 TaxID=2959663 RepID=UPI0020CD50A6|nr:DnaA/Hda family protein [Shimia sp. CNT1-13L.2]MCP9483644.1 DnaA/Hda family protein [Shimia sp. CNT1-13L.2]
MAEQLNLTLPVRTALGRDDFFVSPANAMALGLVDMWPDWPGGKLVLSGPAGSGKTHLTHVWAGISNARIVPATSLPDQDIPALATGPVAVEDVHLIAGDKAAQDALFHLHNLVLAERHTLLLTGAGEPKHWGLTLPDLMSRMQGTTVAALDQPDDTLLTVVMAKMFNDRQLTPPPDTLPFLIKNMDRSFEAARDLVERLDTLSLSEKRPITRALARRVLEER